MSLEGAVWAGQIVIADWRGDALGKEPNKLRPAVVVEAEGMFSAAYPNVLLVPLADTDDLIIRHLAVPIAPTAQNRCSKPCWAVSHLIMTTSKLRIRPTNAYITQAQLAAVRTQMAIMLGIGR